LEDTYQLLKSFIQVKPYPSLEGFKTIFEDLAKRVPAAKTANAKEMWILGSLTSWTSPAISTGYTASDERSQSR